ncbi:class I SAM-dependent methyltransferase [Francisella sciaenopsi]|uniref:Class I SAM-dependent methyltransferase n=1 Tax=Francisella sciaenopsi TaxID=3055034 RepID=A0ABQ6PFV3_9GAMM
MQTGSSSRLKIVDHNETYGRHILDFFSKEKDFKNVLDIGCGAGSDLLVVRKNNARANLTGVDFGNWNQEKLSKNNIRLANVDIEKDKLPFEDNNFDLVIANQVLEHTKEIFWINHEIFRCLKVGGYLYIGVPNILSLHNRIFMLFGYHPTCSKSISAHVRGFSPRDIKQFYRNIAGNFCTIENVKGSQFYPFPKKIARFLSMLFPSLAVSNFFVIKKTSEYTSEFIDWPKNSRLETNYFIG